MANDTAHETKVYGMPAETGRWVFVLAGMIMNLCLGTVYAWSVFRKPLQDFFSTPEVKITATQTLLPFVLFLALFTVLMPISGRLLQRGIHPRVLSIIGSVIVAAGWILSRYASDINFLYLTYGVIAGAGVGIVYGIPIAVVTRWFPDMKGIAVGITVLGFGASALITAYVAKHFDCNSRCSSRLSFPGTLLPGSPGLAVARANVSACRLEAGGMAGLLPARAVLSILPLLRR